MSETGPGWAPLDPGQSPTPPPPPPPPAGSPPPAWSAPGWGAPAPWAQAKAGNERTGPLPLHPMTLGDILDGSFKLLKANARTVIGITAAITVPVQILSALLLSDSFLTFDELTTSDPSVLDAQAQASSDVASLVGGLFVTFLSLLIVPFVTGAISRVVAASYLGDELRAGAALRLALRKFPALLGAWILVHIVEVFGFVLCILPSLAFMALYQATAPAIVVEELGPMQGMRRSWRLMRPRFWPVLGIAVLSGLMASVIGSIVGGVPSIVAFLVPQEWSWIFLAISGILTTLITTPFIAIVATLVYFDARIRHEGFDLEVIAADLERRRAG